MNVYNLQLAPEQDITQQRPAKIFFTHLPMPLLMDYSLWFCNLRWLFIGFLVAAGTIGEFFPFIEYLGIRSLGSWLILSAGMLSALNIVYIYWIKNLREKTYNGILTNIWLQIVLDLIVLTFLIHKSGVFETNISYAYLFHIVLACIFFPSHQSIWVTIIVCVLHLGNIFIEASPFLPSTGLYLDTTLRDYFHSSWTATGINIVTSVGIWVVVWYLASHLSRMVREREYELIEKNRNLVKAKEEKTKHLLRTTHELKTPFAAIDANVQLLLKGHCGYIPDQALQVLERIAERSRKLSHEIQEMLQLANLDSTKTDVLKWKEINLLEEIEWSVTQISPIAERRNITFDIEVEPVFIKAVEDHMKMLFINLISNAVIYSHDSGTVNVRGRKSDSSSFIVSIEDKGIGIQGEKISKIFNEYYRTDEAARYNKSSTGLGLSIVRQVALIHKIAISVSSQPGVGTKFELSFPRVEQHLSLC